MANELITCRNAIRDLLDEIATYEEVWTYEPKIINTRCEVAVLMDSGTGGQFATSADIEPHSFLLRTYMPIASYPQGAEDEIAELWDLQRDKFNAHVTLDGTATRSNLEGYTTGYLLVSSVKCRIMDSTLEAAIVTGVTYA